MDHDYEDLICDSWSHERLARETGTMAEGISAILLGRHRKCGVIALATVLSECAVQDAKCIEAFREAYAVAADVTFQKTGKKLPPLDANDALHEGR